MRVKVYWRVLFDNIGELDLSGALPATPQVMDLSCAKWRVLMRRITFSGCWGFEITDSTGERVSSLSPSRPHTDINVQLSSKTSYMLKPLLQNGPRWPLAPLPLHLHLKHQSQVHQRQMRRNPRCKSRRSLIGMLSSHISLLAPSNLPLSTHRLKKECKSDGVKFQGSPKTIKIDEVWEQSEFEAIFSGKGTLIQPTPDNKPKSTVTIIHFVRSPLQSPHTWYIPCWPFLLQKTQAQVEEFFGGELKDLKGNQWTRGGGPRFAKSLKQGPCDVEIMSFEVNYSKNGMKCSLKFEISEVDGGYCPYYGPSQRRRGWFWFLKFDDLALSVDIISFLKYFFRFVIILQHRSLLYHSFACI